MTKKKNFKCETWQIQDIYTERDFLLFFLFPFHTDTVKSITSKLFWFCFSFSFLLPSIISKFPHLWKIKMEESLVCVTLQALERLFKVPIATSSRNIWKCRKKIVCVGRGACSAFILLSPVSKKYLTLLKFQSNQTLVFQRFTRIPFEKLGSVRQNNVQKTTPDGGRCWLFALESQYQRASAETTLPKYSEQQCSNKRK